MEFYMELGYGLVIDRTCKKLKHELQKELYRLGYDITVDQWIVIHELYNKGNLSQIQLANNTYKDAPTITRILDLLLKKDLISKIASPNDRRKFEISLTAKGRVLVEDMLPNLYVFRKQGWKDLTEEDFENLRRILDKIYDNYNGS